MRDNLKIAFLFILVVVCMVFIIRNTSYKNILLLILPFLSFYLGKLHERRKGDKEEGTRRQLPSSNIPQEPNIPQEFEDEQNKFKEMMR